METHQKYMAWVICKIHLLRMSWKYASQNEFWGFIEWNVFAKKIVSYIQKLKDQSYPTY